MRVSRHLRRVHAIHQHVKLLQLLQLLRLTLVTTRSSPRLHAQQLPVDRELQVQALSHRSGPLAPSLVHQRPVESHRGRRMQHRVPKALKHKLREIQLHRDVLALAARVLTHVEHGLVEGGRTFRRVAEQMAHAREHSVHRRQRQKQRSRHRLRLQVPTDVRVVSLLPNHLQRTHVNNLVGRNHLQVHQVQESVSPP